MVSFKGCYLFQVSVLIVLLCMTLSNASESIDAVCAKTKAPASCQQVLKSAPGAATADLKGLAKISLDLANSNAAKTLDQLRSLIPKTTDPKLQEGYKSCSEQFDDAIGSLKESETDFNQGDFSGMNIQASAAMTSFGDCDDEIKDLAADPSIKKGSQDLNQIIGIVLAVSNLL